jgi:hypothetical protein
MGVFREYPDDLHSRIGSRIGRIDDAERRFAARHEQQGGAHAFGRRDSRLHRAPQPELFEGRFLVFARRNRVGSAMASRPP